MKVKRPFIPGFFQRKKQNLLKPNPKVKPKPKFRPKSLVSRGKKKHASMQKIGHGIWKISKRFDAAFLFRKVGILKTK